MPLLTEFVVLLGVFFIFRTAMSALMVLKKEAVSKWAQGKLVLVIFEKAGHTPQEEYPEKFNPLAV